MAQLIAFHTRNQWIWYNQRYFDCSSLCLCYAVCKPTLAQFLFLILMIADELPAFAFSPVKWKGRTGCSPVPEPFHQIGQRELTSDDTDDELLYYTKTQYVFP